MQITKDMIGRKVRFLEDFFCCYYPKKGTIGVIVQDYDNPRDWRIQWPKGSTELINGEGIEAWYCDEAWLELVKEDNE